MTGFGLQLNKKISPTHLLAPKIFDFILFLIVKGLTRAMKEKLFLVAAENAF